MSNRVKLIAIDLDYTLLDRRFELSDRNKDAIARARDSGIIVTLATGRMLVSALPFANALGLRGPLITYNGAYIRSLDPDRVLSHTPVERAHALEVIRFAAKEDLHCSIYIDDRLYMSKNGWEARMYTTNCRVDGIYEPDLESVLEKADTPPTKVLLIGEAERMPEVEQRLKGIVSGEAYVTSSVPEYVEMMNKNVSKGRALALVADYFGVSSSEVMAIGDRYNDVDMLRYAGVGVAMGNSSDEVKSAADLVVPSNDEHGVAVAIDTCLTEFAE
ncbi:MAG: Cof-type HAD-IIB family hydrolase [Bacillota bacterium]